MRALVQRVTSAAVSVDGEEVARISPPAGGQGLLVLLGVGHHDDPIAASNLARRVWRLRILDDEKSASDVDAPILVVSQFTLMADTRKSRRPSWSPAAPRAVAEPLVDAFGAALRDQGATVEVGKFGEHMQVSLVNDGPVTVLLDS